MAEPLQEKVVKQRKSKKDEVLCDLMEYDADRKVFVFPCNITRLPGQFLYCSNYLNCDYWKDKNGSKPYEL